jgi:hypothetical protein
MRQLSVSSVSSGTPAGRLWQGRKAARLQPKNAVIAPAPQPARRPGNFAANTKRQQGAQPTAASAHAPARIGVRVIWAADANPATIADYRQRLPDGRILASYTPEELAGVLAIMGSGLPITADTIRAELAERLRELPPLGAGDLPEPTAQPVADSDADYWQFVISQEAEALALAGE